MIILWGRGFNVKLMRLYLYYKALKQTVISVPLQLVLSVRKAVFVKLKAQIRIQASQTP